MRDLLLGIAIAYFSLTPEGKNTVRGIARKLGERYLMPQEKKEGKDNEKEAAQH